MQHNDSVIHILFRFFPLIAYYRVSQVALAIKNLPANSGDLRETRIGSLDQEDPLDEGMATHSSILAWRIPWAEEPGGLQLVGHKVSDMTEATEHTSIGYYKILNIVHSAIQ